MGEIGGIAFFTVAVRSHKARPAVDLFPLQLDGSGTIILAGESENEFSCHARKC